MHLVASAHNSRFALANSRLWICVTEMLQMPPSISVMPSGKHIVEAREFVDERAASVQRVSIEFCCCIVAMALNSLVVVVTRWLSDRIHFSYLLDFYQFHAAVIPQTHTQTCGCCGI